jgi:AcrR family transcriptional regulator
MREAEKLFAREGFDRVTLRQIARASGQGNVAAVQYHFGSKEGLLAAIVDAHRAGIDEERRVLLEESEARGQGEDLSTLLRILIEPLARKLDSPSGRAYLRIQAQGLGNEKMRPATRVMVQRIGRIFDRLEGLEPNRYRDRFGILLLFHALADRARQEENGGATRNDRKLFERALSESLHGLYRHSAHR